MVNDIQKAINLLAGRWQFESYNSLLEIKRADIFRTIVITDEGTPLYTECWEDHDNNRLVFSTILDFDSEDLFSNQTSFPKIKNDLSIDYCSLNYFQRLYIQRLYSQSIQPNRRNE